MRKEDPEIVLGYETPILDIQPKNRIFNQHNLQLKDEVSLIGLSPEIDCLDDLQESLLIHTLRDHL
jgi:hypothetical protein